MRTLYLSLILTIAAYAQGPTPGGTAVGDLCGTYPAPTVCGTNGASLPVSAIALATNSSGQIVSAGTTGTGNSVFQNDPSIPNLYGGTATGSDLTLNGTSNGSPSAANVLINTNGQYTSIGSATTPPDLLTVNNNASSSLPASIGTASSTLSLIGKDGDYAANQVNAFQNGTSSVGPYFILSNAAGTGASPTALASGSPLGNFAFYGYNGSAYAAGGYIAINTAQTWTTGAEGTQMMFQVKQNGTTSTLNTGITILNTGQVELPDTPSSTAADSGALCYNSSTGAVTYNPSSTCLMSSELFKHGIKPLYSGLSLIEKLKPVTFHYNETGTPHTGLIAEDVAKVDTSLVAYDRDGKLTGVEYLDLVSVLIRAIQEQQTEIDELKRGTR